MDKSTVVKAHDVTGPSLMAVLKENQFCSGVRVENSSKKRKEKDRMAVTDVNFQCACDGSGKFTPKIKSERGRLLPIGQGVIFSPNLTNLRHWLMVKMLESHKS